MSTATLEYAVARGRVAWRVLATDRCLITRDALEDDTEWVPQVMDDQGGYPEQGRVTIYRGPCRMQVKADINSNVVETTAGEHEFTYLTSQLQLPVTLAEAEAIVDPEDGDDIVEGDPGKVTTDNIVEWLTAPYADSMPTRQFNLAGPYHKSQAVYLRFRVKEPVA